jgi:hypothetical protein
LSDEDLEKLLPGSIVPTINYWNSGSSSLIA